MKIGPWRDEAAAPHEVRAAKLFEQAARLQVPPPPAFSSLETSPAAKALQTTALARKAALKVTAIALVGTGALLSAWWWSPPTAMPARVEARKVPTPAANEVIAAHPAVPTPAPPRLEVPPAPETPARRTPLARVQPPTAVPPEPAPVAEGPGTRASTLGEEAALLASALQALRQEKDPKRAVAMLVDYHSRFPTGVLRPEALLAQAQAERALHHAEAALALLEEVGPTANERLAGELDLTRGELLAELESCEKAEEAFTRALGTSIRGPLAERAAWGRARCAARRFAPSAGPWLRAFLTEYPESAHVPEAKEFLELLAAGK